MESESSHSHLTKASSSTGSSSTWSLLEQLDQASNRLDVLLENTARRIGTAAAESAAGSSELALLLQTFETSQRLHFEALHLEVEAVKKVLVEHYMSIYWS